MSISNIHRARMAKLKAALQEEQDYILYFLIQLEELNNKLADIAKSTKVAPKLRTP